MNSCVLEFYKKAKTANDSGFYDLIFVENSELSYEEVLNLCPSLPRGWFELTKLDKALRIEFARDFCLSTLPYVPKNYPLLSDFFSKMDDIGVVLIKKNQNSLFECELVYSMQSNLSFFRGSPPCSEEMIDLVNRELNECLPKDFLAFLKIHNGFSKNYDSGIIKAECLKEFAQEFQGLIINNSKIIKCGKKQIDPSSLIPFYQSYSKGDFQCFYLDWFSQNDIGNVYYSSGDLAISDFNLNISSIETLAFPSFLEWLIFYIEEVEL
ncbi:MAG: SMI1/KNR4 family protein [Chlamydiae bacterium]|nr:SMI1/KNR4 family protein [Chlamydiota bacterium]